MAESRLELSASVNRDMALDQRLRSVFAAVLDIDPTRLREEDTNQSVAEWDSVTH